MEGAAELLARAVVELDDAELGKLLLDLAIADEINRQGFVPSEELVVGLRAAIAKVDSGDRPNLTVLEKALKLAGAGEYERAGRLLRNALREGAVNLHTAVALQSERGLRKKRASAGGKKTAESTAAANATRNRKILEDRDKLLTSGRSPRDVASILAARHGVSSKTIRRIFQGVVEKEDTR